MVSNGHGGSKGMQRKRKQVNNKGNPKKFRSNFRGNNGDGGGGFSQFSPMQRDQQRDFACDYIDFEHFDAYDDTTARQSDYYSNQQRGSSMSQWDRPMSGPNVPFRESRPLLPLPPGPAMYGPPRRHMPPPMPIPPMLPMPPMGRPPMPIMPPRPLMRRPFGPPLPFVPPGPPMRGLMRPPMRGGRLMGRGGMRGAPGDRKRRFAKGGAPNKTLKKNKKRVGTKTAPTPPQELNDMTKPWITEEIREANAKKIELNKMATKTADPKDWKVFWEAREKVKTMVQAARLEYIGNHPDEDVEKILSDKTTKVDDQKSGDTTSDSKPTETGNTANLSLTVDNTETQKVKVESVKVESLQAQSTVTNVPVVAKTSPVNDIKPAVVKTEPIQNSKAEAPKATEAKTPQATPTKPAPAADPPAPSVTPSTVTPQPAKNTSGQPETSITPVETTTPTGTKATPNSIKTTPNPTKNTPTRGGRGGQQRGRGRGGQFNGRGGGANNYNTRTTRSMGGNYNQRGYY